jgi:hypothetical protein
MSLPGNYANINISRMPMPLEVLFAHGPLKYVNEDEENNTTIIIKLVAVASLIIICAQARYNWSLRPHLTIYACKGKTSFRSHLLSATRETTGNTNKQTNTANNQTNKYFVHHLLAEHLRNWRRNYSQRLFQNKKIYRYEHTKAHNKTSQGGLGVFLRRETQSLELESEKKV